MFAILGIYLLIIPACSTKKNTFVRRTYHNLTAHYNAYWNGNESFKSGVRDLESKAKDNYTLVLPVYKYGTEQDAQSIFPNMDRAIEKASKVIQKHSMYFGRKEYVKWIDDSYLLIGKSYFYKKEFSSARRTFEFVTNRFAKDDARYEAELWLARTYNQTGEFEKSESILDNLNSSLKNGKAPSYLEKDFTQVYANFYVLQQEYESSIEYLDRAIEVNRKKQVLNRLRFVLAQVYQELGELEAAAKLYETIIKKNPTYEMSFNAKINLAKTYNAKTGNRSMIVKKLNKMLKDAKNEEYRDQIYYALAEIYLKDNQVVKGVEYLTLSVATSVQNDYQKSVSSLRLADIHFETPNYPLAQAYYDTAMQVLPQDFPNYEELKEKTEVLTGLITNLTVVQEQDSLQRMAQMPEKERNAILDELIKKIAEEEEKERLAEIERQRTLSVLEQNSRMENRNMQQSGGWYFSNPTAVSFGFSEFQKKWGRRKLEDLWRLSNKQIVADFGEEVDGELPASDSLVADSLAVAPETDPKKREFYLQDLPLTEEKLAESDSLIEEALYTMGFIYLDGLKDNLKSIETFELLLERFPETDHALQVYYQLYKNYELVPDQPKSDYYRDLIVQEYPDSDYAKLIVDPNYNLVLEAQRNAAKTFYQNTYSAYMSDQFYLVINNYNEALAKFPESSLISKFEFLRALAVGKVQNLDSLAVSMQNLIDTYPDSEVEPLARDILSRLSPDEEGNMVLNEQPVARQTADSTKVIEELIDSPYVVDPDGVHFFLLLVDGSKTNINALKIRLSDFNSKYFRTNQLKINSIIFKGETQMVTVGNFENADKVMTYYKSILQNPYIIGQIEDSDYEMMVITVDNYPVFYREKDVNAYKAFFESNYLSEED
jgi:tetratricopeptide (TPR) repeat protein